MIPKLIRLSRSAPKNRPVAWDRYWAGIAKTGAQSEVLWDSGSDHELLGYLDPLLRHFDPALPVVDVGCGHGSFTRALAPYFPQALGVDVSAHAVARARSESAGMENIRFLARDMTGHGAGTELAKADLSGAELSGAELNGAELNSATHNGSGPAIAGPAGPAGANVFIRGVLHVLEPADQVALVENLRQLAGSRGTVFLAETNFQGNPVEYVTHLGATIDAIPAPLERAIRELPMPGHFGPAERSRAMPPDAWELLEDGPAVIETNPMTGDASASLVPGYFAVLRPRQ
ncbi:MAG: Methyltransferase type 12 [Pseudarthrobacter sp.]|nr:Methyltransferase type 12 [Pseudarthrobacter sp.]